MKLALLLAAVTFASALFAADTKPATTRDREGEGRFEIGPDYKNDPAVKEKEGVPKGEVIKFTMDSKDSKIYPGRNGPYKRSCSLYIPDGYKKGSGVPLPVLIVQDGDWYAGDTIKSLDNLIAEKRIPAMAAVFLHNGGGDSRGSQRGLEYDTVSGKYSDFVETEVLPMLEKKHDIKFTTDPDGRATAGWSSGAAAAFSMAWFHPERYHRVLSYSGTFVNQQSPGDSEYKHGAWEYHERLIKESEVKPIRIWMHVSENDNGKGSPASNMRNWLIANDNMAAIFKEKGYHYQYVFAKNAGHTEGKVTKQMLPAALEWLWKGYKPSGK
jgi:enterochelin esterase-like enzyme